MGIFRKSEIGIGSMPPRGLSELEGSIIGLVEPSVGQKGFCESCLLSCRLGQFDPVKWKINKPEKKEARLETPNVHCNPAASRLLNTAFVR